MAACAVNGGGALAAAAIERETASSSGLRSHQLSTAAISSSSTGGSRWSCSRSARIRFTVPRNRIKRQQNAFCGAVCTMASTVANKRARDRGNWNKSLTILREFQSVCSTPVDNLWSLVDEMVQVMQEGLDAGAGAKMLMLLTFVDNLPSGKEQGTYYALDLGGTNFRVLRVYLGEDKRITSESREVAIPPKLMHGTNVELFDFIAGKLAEFAAEDKEAPTRKLELGFTFSFPIHQTSINSGYLINWTKGFSVPDTVGKDVVQELEAAIDRQGLGMRVSALVNDTVGTLARGHFMDRDVMISVILGTGTNACYVERADVIGKYKQGDGDGIMVINTEWGSSWSSMLPRADVDEELDQESINPGDQFFEKLVSGMYLGEILRRLLVKMATEAQLFGDEVPAKLKVPYSLTTPMMCAMHQDSSTELKEVDRILTEALEIDNTCIEVRALIVEAAAVIAERAARLAGAGIVGLLKKIGRDGSGESGTVKSGKMQRTVVAVDGGLYDHYPKFRQHLKDVVKEMLGEVSRNVKIELTRDGSGVGAALIAASAAAGED